MPMYGNESRRTASEIYAAMQNNSINAAARKRVSRDSQALARRVYDLCCEFLNKHHLVNAGVNVNDSRQIISVEDFSLDADVSTQGDIESDVKDLVEEVNASATEGEGDHVDVIPSEAAEECAKSMMALLAKFQYSAGNNDLYRNQHFAHGKSDITPDTLAKNVNMVFAPSLYDLVNNIGVPSEEAFGANIDKVLPDIRAAMTVTLLQYCRGAVDRLVHRRTSTSPYVKWVVPYAEVYDMLKSNDADHNVRDNSEHIQPFIELYSDPRVVSNQLQPIVPLVDNDDKGVLYADGFVKFNQRANLFDLSKLANQLGKSHYNYTDLVSENVILDSILVKLSNGTKTEVFQIPTRNVNGARLQMLANTNDSGNRGCLLTYTVKLTNAMKTISDEKSTILANCTDDDYIALRLSTAVSINLKRSDVEGIGNVSAEARNRNHAAVAEAVATLANNLTVSLEAYAVDARYSEENLRKSNVAIRYHVRTFDFEISNGRNILVDYSMEEELPDFLMSLVTEATSLGQDHRAIDLIIKELLHVYDVTNLENADPDFRERLDRIGFQYVASQMVRPIVYLNTIDLDNVDTIRSSDYLGDIRQYVETLLLNLISLLNQNSFYKHQLPAGEKQVFKVLTSSIILENLFSIPHIHNHLNTETAADGNSVEYRRVLPNGTILDCISTTFNYLRDKILILPWREDADSILNFGHNWDFGNFIAHYNPQIGNGVNKRVFSNTRTMVVPTNPMGLYLDVRNISKIIDMFQTYSAVGSGVEKTSVPQPSDLVVEG